MRPPLAADIYSDEAEAKRQALRADVDLFLRKELSPTQTQALLAQAEHDEGLAAYIEQMRALYQRHEALLKSGLIWEMLLSRGRGTLDGVYLLMRLAIN